MDLNELIEEYFGQDQIETVKENLPSIINIFQSNPEKLVIECNDIDQLGILRKQKNQDYLKNEILRFIENGIKIISPTKATSQLLLPHIPRTVKDLTIPYYLLGNIEVLKNFPNLETLSISDYASLTPEEIEWISNNTQIKNITLKSSATFNEIKLRSGYTCLECGYKIADYKGLRIKYNNILGTYSKHPYAYLDSQSKLPILKELYESMAENLTHITGITIEFADLPLNNSINIGIKPNEEVPEMTFKQIPPTTIRKVFNETQSHLPVKRTRVKLYNQTYEDIYELKALDKKSDLKISYNGLLYQTTYDEFVGMRATIDYYKELIGNTNLSPVEKVAYVYDLLKGWKYKENQNKDRARQIHGIIEDGTIVCVGYSEFAHQLLSELGIPSTKINVDCLLEDGTTGYHTRNIIRVDDDKYNIHGLFAMDITWDSDRDVSIKEEEGVRTIISRPEPTDNIVRKYDNLVLYRHFLIPMDAYELRYQKESLPDIYHEYKEGNAKRLTEESKYVREHGKALAPIKNPNSFDQHNALFQPEEGPLTVYDYFSEPKPSLETFKEIISNVRKAQGYNQEETKQEAEQVVELHHMLNEQNPDNPNLFFKSEKNK